MHIFSMIIDQCQLGTCLQDVIGFTNQCLYVTFNFGIFTKIADIIWLDWSFCIIIIQSRLGTCLQDVIGLTNLIL